MADIHQVITLGIGTPSDIAHFILWGLSPTPSTTPCDSVVAQSGLVDGADMVVAQTGDVGGDAVVIQ